MSGSDSTTRCRKPNPTKARRRTWWKTKLVAQNKSGFLALLAKGIARTCVEIMKKNISLWQDKLLEGWSIFPSSVVGVLGVVTLFFLSIQRRRGSGLQIWRMICFNRCVWWSDARDAIFKGSDGLLQITQDPLGCQTKQKTSRYRWKGHSSRSQLSMCSSVNCEKWKKPLPHQKELEKSVARGALVARPDLFA